MYISNINSINKTTVFKGIDTLNTNIKQSTPYTVYRHDKNGMPAAYTTKFQTMYHDYYKMIDETEQELESFKSKYSDKYEQVYENTAEKYEIMQNHGWKYLGILPIKVAEWAQYTAHKAAMKAEDIFFIERVLERFNLKHLIK